MTSIRIFAAPLLFLALAACAATTETSESEPPSTKAMKKLTPILTVDEIEPCLPFWVDALGFEQTVAVPEGDVLGFVILVRDDIEIMLQTTSSVANDNAALGESLGRSTSCLYIEVEDLEAATAGLWNNGAIDVEVVVPKRTTFYGSTEIFVREPGGNVIGFAQPGEAPPEEG